MRKTRHLYNIPLLVLTLLLISSCVENYGSKMSSLFTASLGDRMKQYDVILLIPGTGCPGCISAAERWVKDHANDPGLMIVFTRLTSRKILLGRLRHFGIEPDERDNIIIDEDNTFFLDNYSQSNYPYAFVLENGVITKSESYLTYAKNNL